MPQLSIETITRVPMLPPRAPDSNKGSFGKVLVVAGSRGMSGAAALAGGAALRTGAGLVRLAVPSEILSIVSVLNPCYTTFGLTQDEHGRISEQALVEVLNLANDNDVLAIGPGLGRGPSVRGLVHEAIAQIRKPLVLDADGLNALAENIASLNKHAQPLVLTPHPGEFARLVGTSIADVQARREELAVAFAAQHQVVLVLKGSGTLVTDGRRLYRNTTGNPGMATGGTGDVLTGMIAALIGQHLEPFEAAQLGVYLHGSAGDLARDEYGEAPLIAIDLLRFIPHAFRLF